MTTTREHRVECPQCGAKFYTPLAFDKHVAQGLCGKVEAVKRCCVSGCSEPRLVNASGGAPYYRCKAHMREQWAQAHERSVAAQGRAVGASSGRKPQGCVVIVRKGKARRWANGVMVQEVTLTRGRLHPGTVEILKRRGYRVEVR